MASESSGSFENSLSPDSGDVVKLAEVVSIHDAPRLKTSHEEESIDQAHAQQLQVLISREAIAKVSFNEWATENKVDVSRIPWTNAETGQGLDPYTLTDGIEFELTLLDATAMVNTFRKSMAETGSDVNDQELLSA